MEYMLAFFALMLGFLAAWVVFSRKAGTLKVSSDLSEKRLIAALADVETQKSVAHETLRLKTQELLLVQAELTRQSELAGNRSNEIATLNAVNENLAGKLENQKIEIESLQKRLTAEFENIATKILKERSE